MYKEISSGLKERILNMFKFELKREDDSFLTDGEFFPSTPYIINMVHSENKESKPILLFDVYTGYETINIENFRFHIDRHDLCARYLDLYAISTVEKLISWTESRKRKKLNIGFMSHPSILQAFFELGLPIRSGKEYESDKLVASYLNSKVQTTI